MKDELQQLAIFGFALTEAICSFCINDGFFNFIRFLI
jgi:hypothetical protein